MKDILLAWVTVLAIVASLIFGMVSGINALTRYQCNAYGEATGREVKYHGMKCYGKIDGVWYSSDEYNKIIVPNRLQLENK